MKPYGLHKAFNYGYEDVHDCIVAGRAGSVRNLPSKSGECHNMTRSSDLKRRYRRILKKIERKKAKFDLKNLIE
jgi:hypothetical protein